VLLVPVCRRPRRAGRPGSVGCPQNALLIARRADYLGEL